MQQMIKSSAVSISVFTSKSAIADDTLPHK